MAKNFVLDDQIINSTFKGVACPHCQTPFSLANVKFQYGFDNGYRVKCGNCGKKYEALAHEDENSDGIFELKVTRQKSLIGIAVNYVVFVNGIAIATLSNGSSVTLKTNQSEVLVGLVRENDQVTSNKLNKQVILNSGTLNEVSIKPSMAYGSF
ncbi:MAG: hypothetical protein LBM27_06255 [Lactobacillaceae bacterium]|jgi:predicted Zn finger-like uncharacterized protein|nr:hypothetical protein [Lactobacillaceae bacterium]